MEWDLSPMIPLLLGWALFVVAYLVPSLIAILRHHHQAAAIVALNFLLGWTFLGWVIALVWSLTSPPPPRR